MSARRRTSEPDILLQQNIFGSELQVWSVGCRRRGYVVLPSKGTLTRAASKSNSTGIVFFQHSSILFSNFYTNIFIYSTAARDGATR